jgi:hypothetical protein
MPVILLVFESNIFKNYSQGKGKAPPSKPQDIEFPDLPSDKKVTNQDPFWISNLIS